MNPGPVLLRRFVCNTKNDPLVDRVDLIDSNQSFACIRYPDGRESTVSVRDLAPDPAGSEVLSSQQTSQQFPGETLFEPAPTIQDVCPESDSDTDPPNSSDRGIEQPIRRSERVSVPPKRYGWD